MFESLKKYQQIFVTGPQRSGTTICGKMIAQDTGFKYVDEFKFGVSNRSKLSELISGSTGNVFQCPGICRYIQDFSNENTLVVIMKRDPADILASQNRIDWKCEGAEMIHYKINERFDLKTIAEIKYRYWDKVQRQKVLHYVEMEYEFLSAHPLWIQKDFRKDFHPKQTFLPKPES
jgi:hypothetical protein